MQYLPSIFCRFYRQCRAQSDFVLGWLSLCEAVLVALHTLERTVHELRVSGRTSLEGSGTYEIILHAQFELRNTSNRYLSGSRQLGEVAEEAKEVQQSQGSQRGPVSEPTRNICPASRICPT